MRFFTYIFVLTTTFSSLSCSNYQSVLNNGSAEEQLALATEMYDSQKYSKAILLFEKLIPSYNGKEEMERIQFMVSQSHYNEKMYNLAAYYFDKFTRNYPNSSKKEEASFLAAHSNYLLSPVYSLDQKITVEAIEAFQKFIYDYPSSKRIPECNKIIKELNKKLERKAFEIAHQYYHTRHYLPAITAFDRFVSEYLGTSYKEDALYFKFLSGYELAMGSVVEKKKERIVNAIAYHDRFAKTFPNSKKNLETLKKVTTLKEELSIIKNIKNES